MATKKRSALKRIRQTVRRTTVKTASRGSARTAVKSARTAITKGGEGMADALSNAKSALDRAAKRKTIHPNSAARRKSRLSRAANKSEAASS